MSDRRLGCTWKKNVPREAALLSCPSDERIWSSGLTQPCLPWTFILSHTDTLREPLRSYSARFPHRHIVNQLGVRLGAHLWVSIRHSWHISWHSWTGALSLDTKRQIPAFFPLPYHFCPAFTLTFCDL